MFVEHAIGREVFISCSIIVPVSELWDDKEDMVRRNAHTTLKMVSETPIGAEGLVESKLVPKLVTKLLTELDEIKILILDELHFCMNIDTTDALETSGMETFTALLSHKNAEIRSRAARNIMDLRYCDFIKMIPFTSENLLAKAFYKVYIGKPWFWLCKLFKHQE